MTVLQSSNSRFARPRAFPKADNRQSRGHGLWIEGTVDVGACRCGRDLPHLVEEAAVVEPVVFDSSVDYGPPGDELAV